MLIAALVHSSAKLTYILNVNNWIKSLQSDASVRRVETLVNSCLQPVAPVSPHSLLPHFYKALERAELPRMRFHDLRHAAATRLLEEKVHPKVVQEMLGYSTISLTLDTYSQILQNMQQEAAEKMDKILGLV